MASSNRKNEDRENDFSVELMFDSIAPRYDFLNHLLSFGIDKNWRKKTISIIEHSFRNPKILDVATGTADLAIMAMRAKPSEIYGIDISEKMLEIGRHKIKKLNLEDRVFLYKADSENIPFDDNTFDVAMAAFGVRNFKDPLKGLSEMTRVVRSKGLVLVLEFSKPQNTLFRQIFNIYFFKILPFVGRIISGNRKAYTYLPDSVSVFPDNELFIDQMQRAGLINIEQERLTGGIASIYKGIKP